MCVCGYTRYRGRGRIEKVGTCAARTKVFSFLRGCKNPTFLPANPHSPHTYVGSNCFPLLLLLVAPPLTAQRSPLFYQKFPFPAARHGGGDLLLQERARACLEGEDQRERERRNRSINEHTQTLFPLPLATTKTTLDSIKCQIKTRLLR